LFPYFSKVRSAAICYSESSGVLTFEMFSTKQPTKKIKMSSRLAVEIFLPDSFATPLLAAVGAVLAADDDSRKSALQSFSTSSFVVS